MASARCYNLPLKVFWRHINFACARNLSGHSNSHRIVSSDDGDTVVCWHPEVDFPYDKSHPIQHIKKEFNSVLKVQNMKKIMSVFDEKKPEFLRAELMRLTYTTKHRWFPEGIHKRRRKRSFEESRPYL